MKRTDWRQALRKQGACDEALAWAQGYSTFKEAWNKCERPDWLLWWVVKTVMPGSAGHRRLVLVACRCARTALRYVPAGEDRPRRAIVAAEQWARGRAGVTLDKVRDAAYDAYAAAASGAAAATADAAYATADAAAATSDVAAAASAAAYAASGTAYAASAAAYATAAATYAASGAAYATADAAAAAAVANARRRLCLLIRRQYPTPPRIK